MERIQEVGTSEMKMEEVNNANGNYRNQPEKAEVVHHHQ